MFECILRAPVRHPSQEETSNKKAKNIKKLHVACLWSSAVLSSDKYFNCYFIFGNYPIPLSNQGRFKLKFSKCKIGIVGTGAFDTES